MCCAQSCPTLCDLMDCSPPGFSVHGDSPGKNTGMSCHALLQGIFRWYRQTLSHLSHQRSPISSEATPPLYSPPPSWEPSLLPLCSLTTFHFMIAFLAFYIVCSFFFFLHSLGTSGAVWDTQQVCRKQLPDWKTVSTDLVIIPKWKWAAKAARK